MVSSLNVQIGVSSYLTLTVYFQWPSLSTYIVNGFLCFLFAIWFGCFSLHTTGRLYNLCLRLRSMVSRVALPRPWLPAVCFKCCSYLSDANSSSRNVEFNRWISSLRHWLACQIPEGRSSNLETVDVIQRLLVVRCVRAHMFWFFANTPVLIYYKYVFGLFPHNVIL